MKTLQQALGQMFRPAAPKKADKHRRAREEAKRLAAECGCEIEPCKPGFNVWPQAGLIDDPWDGDHYCQDWNDVLVMTQSYWNRRSA